MQARVIDLLGERSLMIGAISHDLRTLLTRLRAASLEEGPLRTRMEDDLDGMDAMLADAIAFARGTTSSVRSDVDLADIVATELAEREVHGTGVEITAHLSDVPCDGDAHALRPVATNLLDNAVKYGSGQIRVRVEITSAA